MFTIEQLEFERLKQVTDQATGKRVYKLTNGLVYPSITMMLQEINKKTLKEWEKRVGKDEANKVKKKAITRGNAVDKVCEDYLLNKDVEYIRADPFSVFHPMKKELDNHVNLVYSVQPHLYSHKLRIAGTADAIVKWDNIPTILDIKTSKKEKKEEWLRNYYYQITLYACCVFELKGIRIPQVALLIGIDHDQPQVIVVPTGKYLKDAIKFVKDWHAKYI